MWGKETLSNLIEVVVTASRGREFAVNLLKSH